jgi:hypothetical protein
LAVKHQRVEASGASAAALVLVAQVPATLLGKMEEMNGAAKTRVRKSIVKWQRLLLEARYLNLDLLIYISFSRRFDPLSFGATTEGIYGSKLELQTSAITVVA